MRWVNQILATNVLLPNLASAPFAHMAGATALCQVIKDNINHMVDLQQGKSVKCSLRRMDNVHLTMFATCQCIPSCSSNKQFSACQILPMLHHLSHRIPSGIHCWGSLAILLMPDTLLETKSEEGKEDPQRHLAFSNSALVVWRRIGMG